MSEFIQSLMTAANNYEPVLAQYGLTIILAAIALEGFGIPVPGQSLLIAGALLSTRGEFDIRVLLVSASLAAIAGSTVGYVIGRIGGRKLLLRLPLNPSRLERMDTICKRYGTLFVVLSRFIDGPRQLASIFVGSLRMPAVTFVLAISAGAVLWVGFWGLGSYYFAQHIHVFAMFFESVSIYTWIATGLSVLVLCMYLLRRHNHNKTTLAKNQPGNED
ncbi:MAG TPA: DedA family protein [Gammaproteobacteria bacterium]|nr:DedA family protein [Gammaproteobacteria bacterium]